MTKEAPNIDVVIHPPENHEVFQNHYANTVIEALENIIKQAKERGLPIKTSTHDSE